MLLVPVLAEMISGSTIPILFGMEDFPPLNGGIKIFIEITYNDNSNNIELIKPMICSVSCGSRLKRFLLFILLKNIELTQTMIIQCYESPDRTGFICFFHSNNIELTQIMIFHCRAVYKIGASHRMCDID